MLKSMAVAVATIALAAGLSAQGAFTPARFVVGTLPTFPDLAVGGGQVILELNVGADGRVAAVTVLRTMPPFTALMSDAVRDWQFVPAEEEPEPERGAPPGRPQRVASKVLVAAWFGPTFGEFSKDVGSESDQTPFPLTIGAPSFPLQAHYAGTVLVEARVDASGSVSDATVVKAAPPYDDAARDGAMRWRFRPARVRGRSVATRAYLVFGFSPALLNNSPNFTTIAPNPPPPPPGAPLPAQR